MPGTWEKIHGANVAPGFPARRLALHRVEDRTPQRPDFSAPYARVATALVAMVALTACSPSPAPPTPSPSEPATPRARPPAAAQRATTPRAKPFENHDPRVLKTLRDYNSAETRDERKRFIFQIAENADLGVAPADVAAALGEVFAREPDLDLKEEILGRLTKIHDPAVVNLVAQGLAPTESARVRFAAIATLEYLGDIRAVPLLQKSLGDPDREVRDRARAALVALTPAR
jgi:hypothetical protein